ncbi:MAG TPA: lamin tail domain-containing protein [Cyclobacteriaceae bacterium]|nr:lamin tail domain-containing protein [Cyclobacteriaceae bacterium]
MILIFGGSLLQDCSSNDPKPVVTSEGIYINELYSTGNDWIELYNDNSSSKDISGYFIYDDASDKYTLPANTIVPSKGFLILNCDGTATGLNTNFKLSSDGETVYFENTSGTLVDMVEFPAMVDGQSYARIPDGTGEFVITGSVTKNISNGGSSYPAIGEVTKAPVIPGKGDAIIVNAVVTDATSLSTVKLFYRLNGGSFKSVSMTLTTNNIYGGTIPATGADATVEYYVEAKNTADKTTLSPADAPTSLYSFIINSDALPKLVVNEFMAANKSCCPDTDGGTSEYDDWFEIYNAGTEAVNIANMYLSDDSTDPFKYKVPATNSSKTTVQPGGYLLIWADNTKSQGELHTNFKLSSSGGSVGIYYIDGRTINEYAYETQVDDVSFGRTTDDADTWKSFNTPTPGASNN